MKNIGHKPAIVAFQYLNLLVLLLFVIAGAIFAQVPKTTRPAPAFEVVSVKYSGTAQDHTRRVGDDFSLTHKPVTYEGQRLSCDTYLDGIIKFAFSPLVSPYRDEIPNDVRRRYYQIDAIAPKGTTANGARAMLATVLTERLGLRYHVAERETSVFFLLSGSGPSKLVPSTEPPPTGPSRHESWLFRNKSASLFELAFFFSSGMRREVVDKTGIPGYYQFDLDWRSEVQQEGIEASGPGLALAAAKRLGLRIVAGKEVRKILVVDRINQNPTPN